MNRGIPLVSGGTDNHLMLINLIPLDKSGKDVQNQLEAVHITANKNTVPNEPRSPFVTSGIRLGTPAVTTRGLKAEDMDKVAEAIAMTIKDPENTGDAARAIVKSLTEKYPLG